MIDRRFYGSEAANPTYIVAAEYDVATNAVRNVTGAHPPILATAFQQVRVLSRRHAVAKLHVRTGHSTP